MQPQRAGLIEKIESLVQEPGYVYALCQILWHDQFYKSSEITTTNWRERLSVQEANYLLGLLIKRAIDQTISTPEIFESQIARTRSLMAELQHSYLRPTDATPGTGGVRSPGLTDVTTEATFYDHPGAYDFQHWEYTPTKYELDAQWLRDTKGLVLSASVSIAQALKHLVEEKRTQAVAAGHRERCKQLLQTFCFTSDDLSGVAAADQLGAVLRAFACTPGTVNKAFVLPGSYNHAESHPLIELGDGRYFLPLGYTFSTSISDSPFYWMLQDEAYRPTAETHRGKTTNDTAAALLGRVLPRVEKNVLLQTAKGETLTDIDAFATCGSKGVILQAKSKRLTALAKTGDEAALRRDFAAAIQDAYDEALVSRKALLEHSATLQSDAHLPLPFPNCDDYFIICVTADHYPGLAHQVETFLKKGAADPWPVVVSLYDLEILAFYLANASTFLHYLHQRARYAHAVRADNEIIYLANYLRRRLYLEPGFNWMSLDPNEAQYIDAHYPVARGYALPNPDVHRVTTQWKNPTFDAIIRALEASAQPEAIDAILFLRDLSSKAIDNLTDNIHVTWQRTLADGEQHSFSTGDALHQPGLIFLTRSGTRALLDEHLRKLVQAKKYQRKASLWFGLGGLGTDYGVFTATYVEKGTWREDHDLATLTATILRPVPRHRLTAKTGRNDPCHCGSGIKYKKCHGKVE
jgi:hypothetical protein